MAGTQQFKEKKSLTDEEDVIRIGKHRKRKAMKVSVDALSSNREGRSLG